MRRPWIVLLLVLVLVMPLGALAEVELSTMSFDELVALREQVDMAIMESDEFKEVEVPIGDWIVGKHIPAGEYTVKPVDYARFEVYESEDKDYRSSVFYDSISKRDNQTIGRIELLDGYVVQVSRGAVIMSRFVGLGF